jgi:phosphoribosylanthranilate isomerase
MKVKVCGITQPEQLAALSSCGAAMAGLIFFKGSPRCVLQTTLSPATFRVPDSTLATVGVFVNEAVEAVLQYVQQWHLDYVQLHGDESPDYCAQLQGQVKIIKAIKLDSPVELQQQLEAYHSVTDYFLFDTPSQQHGGTGKKFDWHLLATVTHRKPFFLSGGISANDVELLQQFKKSMPLLEVIDINSQFETAPGIKALLQVTDFITALQNETQHD